MRKPEKSSNYVTPPSFRLVRPASWGRQEDSASGHLHIQHIRQSLRMASDPQVPVICFCIITTPRIKSPQQGSCRTRPPIWSVPFTWRHAIHNTGSFCAGHCGCTKSKARDASQPRHEVVSVAQALRRKPSTGWERGSVRAPRPQQQGQLLGDVTGRLGPTREKQAPSPLGR